MKKYLKNSVLAIMAMMTVCMFTACGGDDDSSDSGASGIGVHRIDVQFSDNAAGCEAMTIFYGMSGHTGHLRADGGRLRRIGSLHNRHGAGRERSVFRRDGHRRRLCERQADQDTGVHPACWQIHHVRRFRDGGHKDIP